jgi:two-component system, LytTR family, sensor kinase
MKNSIKRYHLITGFLLATVLPGTFVFSGRIDDSLFYRFLISFLTIFSFWVIIFTMVDFSPLWIKSGFISKVRVASDICKATLLAITAYIVLGLLDDSRTLLSQVKGALMYSPKAWFYLLLRLALVNGLIALIKYLYDFSAEKARIQSEVETLKRENIMAMHETLKQQLNPHFLFNSLNTLKSLVKQNPTQSLSFIDELSSIYRYMLVHSGKNEVTLREEIEFVTSYLNLLKIRYGDSLIFGLSIPDNHLSSTIPPNTLQVLIENAVKHNVHSKNRPLRITIYTKDKNVVIENNLQLKAPEGFSSHVGLTNINNRYLILKGKRIIIENIDGLFKVKLPISA